MSMYDCTVCGEKICEHTWEDLDVLKVEAEDYQEANTTLVNQIREMSMDNARKNKRIEELEKALEFYADCMSWDNEKIKNDHEYYGGYNYLAGGKRARQALKKENKND